MNPSQQKWTDGARALADMLAAYGDDKRSSLAMLVLQRFAMPQAYVTVVGETSTGKSSLINALMEKALLPVSATPTSGVVTHIVCRNEVEPRFFAIYRDATQEAIDYERFCAQSIEPGDDILRLQVRARPGAPGHVGMHVFDTPGYNAVLSKHEEVLTTFLPQSDVIVFTAGYRTGFGQSDQDLCEAVAAATAHDTNIPVVLAINRAPDGCGINDKRVAEILRLAEDGLKRKVSVQIIHSTNRAVADGPLERRTMDAQALWDEVHTHAFAPAVLEATQRRLQKTLIDIVDDAYAALEREEAGLSANADQYAAIRQAVKLADGARAQSHREIDETMRRLEAALPDLVDKLAAAAMPRVEADIMSANKWLGHADCAQWIAGHCLPFEVRGIGRAIEDHLAVEIDALNQRLEEIANTTIAELDKTVALQGEDPVYKFAKSLSATLAQRLTGTAVNSMLRGMGGVGGAAAGAGNFVKSMVARVGRLFGTRFSREVYNQIGRIFTKRMLERLNVAVLVITEMVSFVYEAQVWQGNLLKSSRKAFDEWTGTVKTDLLQAYLPEIRQANYDIVDALYSDIDPSPAPDAERDARLAEVRAARMLLANLRECLNSNNEA